MDTPFPFDIDENGLHGYERDARLDMRGGECWACEETLGYRRRHNVVFSDSRTMRNFCHEHVIALAQWELDGPTDKTDVDLSEWVKPDG